MRNDLKGDWGDLIRVLAACVIGYFVWKLWP